ncbi:MAG: 30S ribosomal protein S16 [bacterium P3]|nr:MAG: 30S ribosomal protein S16 [bacterium P3]KWW42296.1 MAG: 30S ribosomal protein S16 [bacterium F083]
MPARIRLQRHGKKNQPFYHIVVADGRAPRDGKFIEKLGTYNPLTNPATIELNCDKAVQWLKNGAQPSETARRILSYKGVLLRRHLQIGVEKGAITQEQADVRFNEWLQAKEAKIATAKSNVENGLREQKKARMDAEKKANEAKAAAVAAKRQAAAEAEAAAKAEAEAAAANSEEAATTGDATPAGDETAEAEAPAAE